MKRLIKLTLWIVVIGVGLVFYFFSDFSTLYHLASMRFESGIDQFKMIERKITTPPPLFGPTAQVQSSLTVEGIVSQTNFHREQHGLPPLSVNMKLTAAAQMKVEDMFARQYFDHQSPTGEGPADLASATGYEYIAVGENLALGNFEDDTALLEGWMNSPGHRENIINSSYTEIGVATVRGTYEGRNIWMAVQEFGRPATDCPIPSEQFGHEIAINQELLNSLEGQIMVKRREVENTRPRRGPEYNQKVEEYNELVNQYNEIVEQTKNLITEYNILVNEYNACILE